MTITLQDAMKIRVNPLVLPTPFGQFLGNIPRDAQWTMLLYGASWSGKSSFALKLAKSLSNYGNVLFANSEEEIAGGTIQIKVRNLGIASKNIYFQDRPTLENLTAELKTGKYKYCFIDSVSAMAMSREKVLEIFNLAEQFPKVSFIFIFHSDKSEKIYIGPSFLKHLVGIAIELVNNEAITIKNRFKRNKNLSTMKIWRN